MLRRGECFTPFWVARDIDSMDEVAGWISDIDAVDIRRSGQRLDQEIGFRLLIGRRRLQQGLRNRGHGNYRVSVAENAAVPVDRMPAQQAHLLVTGSNGRPRALLVGQPHQRHGDRDEQYHDDDAEMKTKRSRPAHVVHFFCRLRIPRYVGAVTLPGNPFAILQ